MWSKLVVTTSMALNLVLMLSLTYDFSWQVILPTSYFNCHLASNSFMYSTTLLMALLYIVLQVPSARKEELTQMHPLTIGKWTAFREDIHSFKQWNAWQAPDSKNIAHSSVSFGPAFGAGVFSSLVLWLLINHWLAETDNTLFLRSSYWEHQTLPRNTDSCQ